MPELHLKRTPENHLVPADSQSLELVKKLSYDKVYRSPIAEERNYQFLKKFIALVKLGWENTDLDMPFEAYRKYITCKAGFCDIYTTPKGHFVEAHSISFAKMDETTFKDVYERVRAKISEEIGATSEEIDNNLQNFY